MTPERGARFVAPCGHEVLGKDDGWWHAVDGCQLIWPPPMEGTLRDRLPFEAAGGE